MGQCRWRRLASTSRFERAAYRYRHCGADAGDQAVKFNIAALSLYIAAQSAVMYPRGIVCAVGDVRRLGHGCWI